MQKHRQRFWVVVGLIAVTAAWLGTRLPGLDERPMHTDEATKAYMLGELMAGRGYRYNPTEHHGPTLVYAARAVAAVRGKATYPNVTETDLRLVAVLAGLAMVLAAPLLGKGLGGVAVIWAVLFFLVDPAFGFYSRYFIHEMLLMGAAMAALACGWRYFDSRRAGWALGFGLSVGLMFATKATFVLMGAAAVGALAICGLCWGRRQTNTDARPPIRLSHAALALLGLAAVWLLLFSSLFTNWQGLADSFGAYTHALKRGSASDGSAAWHHHPWHFHLHRVLWWEFEPRWPTWSQASLVALALAGTFFALRRKQRFDVDPRLPRFLVFYTLLLFVIYSAMPYKTPWLVLGPMQGVILLAGYGAAMLVRACRRVWYKDAMILVLLALCGHLGFQAHLASHVYPHQPYNPWVYAHTNKDVLKMFKRIDDLAALFDDKNDMPIHVIAQHQWPMPWYLRGLRVEKYDTAVPDKLDTITAPVLILDEQAVETLEQAESEQQQSWLRQRYLVEAYGVRPQVLICLCIEKDLWERFMDQRRSVQPIDDSR